MNERFVERMNRAIALGLEWPDGERRSHASLRSSTVTGGAAAVDPQEVRGRRARGLSAAGHGRGDARAGCPRVPHGAAFASPTATEPCPTPGTANARGLRVRNCLITAALRCLWGDGLQPQGSGDVVLEQLSV
jgi:hypothetical protein